jgi:glutathione synthase/RimK-type ligase-like ATP-grasp enzyme
MPKCVLLACDDLTDYVVDDDLLLKPFQAVGWEAEFVSWSQSGVDWTAYDAAIIRATWDYTHRLDDYLAVLRRIEELGVPLYNPYSVIAWNAHKKYLMELEAKGVPIVPTRVYGDVHDVPFDELFDTFDSGELIIKPMVSAGAYKTYRFTREQLPALREKFLQELAGHDLMLQPFIGSLLEAGEYSLFYFNGEHSHTIVKQPQPGDFRVQEEHGGIISPAVATPAQCAVGEAVLRHIPDSCLYARVDIVASREGEWQVMEVELIEPSLYFRMDEASPMRFVRAFLERAG